MYYVYLLKSRNYNQVYVGSTNNLMKRLEDHNSGKEISTRRYMPWDIYYYEAYSLENLARQREKRLKHNGNAIRELKKRIGLDKSGGSPSTTFRYIHKSGAGFTLIELLIVIGILAILAVVVVLVLNPTEFLKQTRDAKRVSELQTLNKAILTYRADGGSAFGSSNVVYVSIPDSSPTCANLGLPSLPSGWSYACSNSDNHRKVNGTGWVPVPFTSVSFGSLLNILPVDPINTVANGHYFTYVIGGSWKLTSFFESERRARDMNRDGGLDPSLYEIGSNLNLLNRGRGLVGYWNFDEGIGTVANDLSGHGNTGTLINGPAWTAGQVNRAISFDGVDDRVNVSHSPILEIQDEMTFAFWFYPPPQPRDFLRLIEKGGWTLGGWSIQQGTVGTRRLDFRFGSETGWSGGFASTISYPDDNRWYHVVAVVKLNNFGRSYLNGNLVGSMTPSQYFQTANRILTIGWSGAFLGLIDDVRIYNRALSDSEIQAIYNTTK